MAPAPGDLLRLSDLEINNKVQAMFEDGFWSRAAGGQQQLCGSRHSTVEARCSVLQSARA